MRFYRILLVVAAISMTGFVQAQTASKLNGKSYTFLMRHADGTGDDIVESVVFDNNGMRSERLQNMSYRSGNVIEKSTGNGTQFQVTLSSTSTGSITYNGTVEGIYISGTADVINPKGNHVSMVFRGMTTEEWNKLNAPK